MNAFLITMIMLCPQPIHLTDIQDPDALPTCVQEDCSDQPGQIGMWLDKDTGDWYYSAGEGSSFRIVDDTVR